MAPCSPRHKSTMAFENSYQLRGWESLPWICSSQLQTTEKGSGGDRRVEYSKTRFFHSRAKRICSVVISLKGTRVNLSNACLPLLLFSHSTLLNYYPFLFFFLNFHFAPKIFCIIFRKYHILVYITTINNLLFYWS
jgi:hypothetical protein